jgi:hypothetical protein
LLRFHDGTGEGLHFHRKIILKFVSTLYSAVANMPKNSAAQEKKVNTSVRLLQTTTGVRVPQAMILAGFAKKDVANEIVRQMVRRRYQQAIITT